MIFHRLTLNFTLLVISLIAAPVVAGDNSNSFSLQSAYPQTPRVIRHTFRGLGEVRITIEDVEEPAGTPLRVSAEISCRAGSPANRRSRRVLREVAACSFKNVVYDRRKGQLRFYFGEYNGDTGGCDSGTRITVVSTANLCRVR